MATRLIEGILAFSESPPTGSELTDKRNNFKTTSQPALLLRPGQDVYQPGACSVGLKPGAHKEALGKCFLVLRGRGWLRHAVPAQAPGAAFTPDTDMRPKRRRNG